MSTFRTIGRTPSRTRRIARVASALGTAALLGSMALLAACADAPTGPQRPAAHAEATASSVTSPTSRTQVNALLRDVPLERQLTQSWTIKRNGGTIDWKEVGLRVVVPPNAFKAKEMTFTVTALAGDVVAYDFGPDGSVFDDALVVTQSLKGTNYYKAASLGAAVSLRGAYFKSASQIDMSAKTAIVDEFQVTDLDLSNSQVRFKVTHFSGYMVSMD